MANVHGLGAAVAAGCWSPGVGVAAQRAGAPAAATLPRRSIVATTLGSVAASQARATRDGIQFPERGGPGQHSNTHEVKARPQPAS